MLGSPSRKSHEITRLAALSAYNAGENSCPEVAFFSSLDWLRRVNPGTLNAIDFVKSPVTTSHKIKTIVTSRHRLRAMCDLDNGDA